MSLQVWLPLNGSTTHQGLYSPSLSIKSTPEYINGKVTDKALNNNGNNHISFIYDKYTTNQMTIAMWINPQSPNDWDDIFSFGGSGNNNWNRIEKTNIASEYRWYGNSSCLIDSSTIVFTLPNNQWSHILVVINGDQVIFYLNGTEVKRMTQKIPLRQAFVDSQQFYLGARYSATQMFEGYFNDFRIYNHALSPREVKLLAQGLVAHYKLDNEQPNLINNSFGEHTSSEYLIHTYQFDRTGFQRYLTAGEKCTLTVCFTPAADFGYFNPHLNSGAWGGWMPNIFSDGTTNRQIATAVSQDGWKYSNGTNHAINPEDVPAYANVCMYHRKSATEVGSSGTTIHWIKLQIGNHPEEVTWSPSLSENKDYYNSYDCSGHGNHGTVSGTLNASTDSPRYSHSTVFPGNTSNRITNTTTQFYYTDNFTWSCWVKHNYSGWQADSNKVAANFAFTVGRADFGPDWGYGLQEVSASSMHIRFGSVSYAISLDENNWHHLAFTKSGNNITIYVDGVPTNYTFTGTLPAYTNSQGLGIGCFWYSGGALYPFYGQLSDFRIYATPLSAAAVKELYQSSISFLDNGTLQCSEIVEKPINLKYNQNGIVQAGLLSEIGYTNKMKTKTLPDGSAWARIHWLDVSSKKEFFTINNNDKGKSEVDYCVNKSNRFSVMSRAEYFQESPLPMEYTQLEYIQAPGDQIIDTEFLPSSNTKIILSYTNERSSLTMVFGGRDGAYNKDFSGWMDSNNFYPSWGNNYYNLKAIPSNTLNNQRIYVMNKNQHTVYGTNDTFSTLSTSVKGTSSHAKETFNTSKPISLFTVNKMVEDTTRIAKGKLYFCQIYENEKLVRDFIPCKRNVDNKVGLYDIINNKFYTGINPDGADFGAGPNIKGYFEFLLTYPKLSSNGYNRWRQTSNPEANQVSNFFPISTTWEQRNGGISKSASANTVYDCDAYASNWFGAIGQNRQWESSKMIPSADGNHTTETELWIRIDNLPKLTKLSMFNEALQAHQIYEL